MNLPIEPEDAITISPKKRIPRWAWIGGGCLGVTVLVIAALIAVPTIFISRWFAESERQLGEEIAILADTSEPSTPEELEAYYQLPVGVTDTTDLWLQGASSFDTDEFRRLAEPLPIVGLSEAAIADPGQPWDALAGARSLLDQYQAALDQLHEAARQGGAARYETHFEDGFAVDAGVVQQLRVAARMLKLEAYALAHEGDSAGAWRSIHTLLRLSQSLENSPRLIDQLVRIAIARIAYDTLIPLLPFLDAQDEALSELMRELADDDFDQGLVNALLGERIQGLHAFDHPESAMDDAEMDAEKLQQWSRNWMMRDRAYYMRHVRRLIEAAREPWPQKLASAKQVGDDLEQLLHDSNKLVQLQHFFSILLTPAQDALFNATGSAVALRDEAILILAIQRFRARNGRLPESLSQLVPECIAAIPPDPFDGQSLRYREDRDRYLVYSIGENLQDDGGDPGPSGRLDVVLSVPITR